MAPGKAPPSPSISRARNQPKRSSPHESRLQRRPAARTFSLIPVVLRAGRLRSAHHRLQPLLEATQQSYAKVGGILDDLPADRLVEDSIAMNIDSFARHGITLDRRFYPCRPCAWTGTACCKSSSVSIATTDEKNVRIAVEDHGIGIPPENLTRAFGHGFTTRKDGHGFGLTAAPSRPKRWAAR